MSHSIKKNINNSSETKIDQWFISDIISALIIFYAVGLTLQTIMKANKELIISIMPESVIYILISIFSFSFGTIYLLRKYPYSLFSELKRKQNIKLIIMYGSIGGIIISILQFPYKTIFSNHAIPENMWVDINESFISISFFLFSVTLIIPFIEELFFRACVYRIIKNRYDVAYGYIINSVIFSLMHQANILQLIQLFLGSMILTHLYEKTNLVSCSIAAHIILNVSWYSAIYIHAFNIT
jgi:membrane protease YdiL (CAAX protease family)